ncbi:MAG: hypothetical protein JWN70_5407 [Planctomycetaceae bacterium]|nr:hypothetical protein [Planctomycetaceae bacterium]
MNSAVVIETGEVMFEGQLQPKSGDGDRMFSSWRCSVIALRRFIFWGWFVSAGVDLAFGLATATSTWEAWTLFLCYGIYVK